MTTPRDIRPVIEAFLKEIALYMKEIDGFVSPDNDSSSIQPSSSNRNGSRPESTTPTTTTRDFRRQSHRTTSSASSINLQHDVERIFARKVKAHVPVEFSKDQILKNIFTISFKGLLEYVRLATFSKNGYQQIQLDCHFIRVLLPHFVKETSTLEYQLSEIVSSASERCNDPLSMEQK